jgi:hypothetical protein
MASSRIVFPQDVLKIVLDEQTKIKKLRGTNQFSIERVVLNMLREWSVLKKKYNATEKISVEKSV